MVDILILVAIAILVLLSGFFSATEIAFTLIDERRIIKAVDEKVSNSSLALKIKRDFNRLISTILVGNNIVNVTSSTLATAFAIRQWGSKLGPTIATIAITIIILIFGEIFPKTLVVRIHFKFCLLISKLIKFFEFILYPIVFILTRFIEVFSPLWKDKVGDRLIDEDVLELMVDEIEEEGFIDEKTGDLLRSTIDFTTSAVYEIMKPRVDVFGFDIHDDQNILLANPNIFKYSRIPIYEDNIDKIIGILNTKKLIMAMLDHQEIDLMKMVTPPIYVHKTKSISSLLKEFKTTRTHIAIVVDEFGGTMGIVTLEDILEELVGDIWDEGDIVEEVYQENEDGRTYYIDGDMNIYDFFDLFELDSKDLDTEYSTVGGWCIEVLERFAQVGDVIKYQNLEITITEVSGLRVEKVQVEVKSEEVS